MPHAPERSAFDAIADPTRRAILDRLASGGCTVGSLAEAFPISRPAVSKHLRVLERAGLVEAEKRGRQRVYALRPEPLAEVDAWLAKYRMFWAARLVALKRHVEGDPPQSQSRSGEETPS